MADAVQVDIPHLSGQTALEAGINSPTSPEAQAQAAAVKNLSLINIDVAAANDIQSGSKDNFNVATFGVKDISTLGDPVLKPIAEGINQLITQLELNLKVEGANGASHTTDQINDAIRTTILSNKGWKDAFNALPSNTEQQELIDTIRETGALSAGRRLYTDRMVIAQESGTYVSAKSKYEEVKKRYEAKVKEKSDPTTGIDKKISTLGKDRTQVIVEKDTATRDAESLKDKKTNLSSRRESLEQSMREITAKYRHEALKKGITFDPTAGRDSDPDYVTYKDQLDKTNHEINGTGSGFTKSIDTIIKDAQSEVKKADSEFQLFQTQDTLANEITILTEQFVNAEGAMITARTTLANKVNDLLKSLNGVLPEAAKEGMNKYIQAQEQANREKAISDAKKKAEDATKEGDVIKRAKAELSLILEKRHLIPKDIKGLKKLFYKGEIQYDVDKASLTQDFQDILKDPDGWVRNKLASSFSGVPGPNDFTGFSPEVQNYFNLNPEALTKFADAVRQDTLVTVSRQAFMNLNLDPKSVQKLCNIKDVATGLEQALVSNKTALAAAEKLAGQGLSKGRLRSFFEKASPFAIGALLLLIFGFFGTKLLSGGA